MWNDTIAEAIRLTDKPWLDLSGIGLAQYPLGTWEDRRSALASIIGKIKYQPVAQRVELTGRLADAAGVRLPSNLMMTSEEVRALRHAGMCIGAHTVSHPILAGLPDDAARREIEESRASLEQILDERVTLFAYPNGKLDEDYSARTVQVVKGLGFDAAVSTEWGSSSTGDDVFQIRRFTPWDRTQLRFGARLLLNLRKA
jgi:peptidoglycan/xylan/chitin deacetylase (PgdA/CDA1 family)